MSKSDSTIRSDDLQTFRINIRNIEDIAFWATWTERAECFSFYIFISNN